MLMCIVKLAKTGLENDGSNTVTVKMHQYCYGFTGISEFQNFRGSSLWCGQIENGLQHDRSQTVIIFTVVCHLLFFSMEVVCYSEEVKT